MLARRLAQGNKLDRRLFEMTVDQRLRRIEGDDLPVVDHRHAIAQLLSLFHIMRGKQNRLSRLLESAHNLPQPPPGLRIKAGRRLIQEDHVRIVDQGQGYSQALRLPAGKSSGSDSWLFPANRPWRSSSPPAWSGGTTAQTDRSVHAPSNAGYSPVVCNCAPTRALICARAAVPCSIPSTEIVPASGCRSPRTHSTVRRLARAVGAKQAKNLARPNLKGHAVDCAHVSVPLDQFIDLNSYLVHPLTPFA